MSSSTSLFDSLPARPPTPPREIAKAIDDAISFLDDSNEIGRLTSKPFTEQGTVNASGVTPSSSQDTTSLSALTKKVDFSPNPTYFKISRPDQSSSPGARLLKRSPPTAKDVKPLKSILKLSYAPPPSPEELESAISYFSPAEPGSFAKMLQSVCHALANPSRAERLDAYLALNGALQTYNGVPDATAILQKMRLLMQFLSRDITCKDATDQLDTQMITQALKLAIVIVASKELSEGIDDDFRYFLIDRSINVLEQADVPKQIVKSHMCLLYQQRFRTPIMNTGRAERLLGALQSIEDKCSGNSIIGYRLMIYGRLVEQCWPAMIHKSRDWLEHVFHGMLSSIKEVRSCAIEACTKAGLYLGQHVHASLMLCEMFDTEVEEGQTYLDYLRLRLMDMLSDKETANQVPQIWSAVVLFFRSKKRPLDEWRSCQTWLKIFSSCINKSDLTIRHEALLAWDKFVFATMPGASTSTKHMSLLKTPMLSALERQNKDNSSRQYRKFALDSFYNLLHYGLRPGLSFEELDTAWDLFVFPVLSKLVVMSDSMRKVACRVLDGLLNENTGVWNGNAALDATPIKPEDLPKLDPKWVRTRLSRFLKVLEPMILQDMRHSDNETSAICAAWHSLMQALAYARSQEVRTTMELKEAVALLIAFFRRIWAGCTPPIDRHRWIRKYVSLVDAAMAGAGENTFTEDILVTTTDDHVEVAPTPSHRGSKHPKSPKSPLVILFGQFYRIPAGLVEGTTYFSSALTILERALSSKVTPAASLELLYRSLHTWTETCGLGVESPTRRELWIVVSKAAVHVLQAELTKSKSQEAQPLGHLLRTSVDIFAQGIVFERYPRLITSLSELYGALNKSARWCAGEGGVVSAVMEPVAKALNDAGAQARFDIKVLVATRILEQTAWPKTRQSLEQARKQLWGVGFTPVKSNPFDPFEHVYRLVVEVMSQSYNEFECSQEVELEMLQAFFISVLTFLQASPISVLATALRKVQDGFVIWVEDHGRKASTNAHVANLVQSGWQSIMQLLKSLPCKDSALLKTLEPLFAAGFSSPHRDIVNQTIICWNETFGSEDSLEYPEKLDLVLRARLVDADINLPSFPDDNDDRVPATIPAFFDSQSPKDHGLHPPKSFGTAGRTMLSPRLQHYGPRIDHVESKSSPVTRNFASPSPAARRTEHRASSLTPKPRLRHDDSQIQFAPIDSSPLPPADESQLLTEHQKEVKDRQHLDAQLFTAFSSSPIAKSTALPGGLPKRLDFAARPIPSMAHEHQSTPTGLQDGNVLASDDMPSSPTPSSTKDTNQGPIDIDGDHEDDEEPHDPPSSPPRTDEDLDDAVLDIRKSIVPADLEVTATNEKDLSAVQQGAISPNNHPVTSKQTNSTEPNQSDTDEMFSASEFPSNTELPDEQLQLQDAGARNPQATQLSRTADSEAHVVSRTGSKDVVEDAATTGAEEEVTRVDDSFANPTSQSVSKDQTDEQSPRANRKRKRREPKSRPSKKPKPQSPMQRVWSTFGFGQQGDDDDMEDNIVVASSQPVPSPSAKQPVVPAEEPKENGNVEDPSQDEVIVERSMMVKEEHDDMQPPAKRGRGRPRKSETPTLSQTEAAPTKTLKRKASNISSVSIESSQVVKDTPAPNKRKGKAGRPPRRSSVSQDSGAQSRPGSSSSREVITVVVSPPDKHVHTARRNSQRPADEEQAEEVPVAADRPMLTPRSILARLKGVLSDFRGMILGSSDEKEFDDVLFELRKETHAAARRGEEQ